jgi:hypothetical protein
MASHSLRWGRTSLSACFGAVLARCRPAGLAFVRRSGLSSTTWRQRTSMARSSRASSARPLTSHLRSSRHGMSRCVCVCVRACGCVRARARDGPLALGAASKRLHVLRLRVGFGRQLPVRGDRDADARGRSARAGAPRPLAQIPMSGMACVGVILCVGTCVCVRACAHINACIYARAGARTCHMRASSSCVRACVRARARSCAPCLGQVWDGIVVECRRAALPLAAPHCP